MKMLSFGVRKQKKGFPRKLSDWELSDWDLGLEAGIWASRLRYGP